MTDLLQPDDEKSADDEEDHLEEDVPDTTAVPDEDEPGQSRFEGGALAPPD